jgi:hypothetical protein
MQYPQYFRNKNARLIEELRNLRNNFFRCKPDPDADLTRDGRDHPDTATIAKVYRQIDYEYMPVHYAGKVTLFWADGNVESPRSAARWWRKTSDNVELHILPGADSIESFTYHAETVAKMITCCIENIDGRS